MKNIEIQRKCDGWTINVDDESFSWDHDNEDYGTESIKHLLEYLGHKVTVEDDC